MHQIPSLQVIDLLLDAVCIVQADSRIVFVSAALNVFLATHRTK